ncbi:MAG TPA: hypothetical protein ENH28_00110 [Euryarchaeota archaeon]|nr:hypothetical protein BMS3Bbin15_00868 [archaeon BMS3Bbin15]HDL14557.1 hypothetical protein [Euryarchaeota archaeon]
MDFTTILYAMLSLSIVLNVLLLLRLKYLKEDILELKGGVELSKEELELLKDRLTKIKNYEDLNE